MTQPRVLVPLLEGFEEIEAVTIIDVLRRAEIAVTIAGDAAGPVRGAQGIDVSADAALGEVDPAQFQMIALPGGMPGSERLATTYTSMGNVHADQKDHARALERYGQAAAIYEAKDPDKAAATYGNMAIIYMRQQDYGKSLEYHRKALAIKERVHEGRGHPSIALSHHNMGSGLAKQGHHAAALARGTAQLQSAALLAVPALLVGVLVWVLARRHLMPTRKPLD